MKKLLQLLAPLTLGLMVGCSYDDSAILDKITEEKEQEEMQAQIDAQQALLDALANNLTITAVTQDDNGYTITFSDGSSMTIKNGEQGENCGQVNSFIESIVVGEEDVTFTLADGTVIVIPLASDSGDTSSEDNKIYYTTSDNTKLFPKTDASLFGAILISNTYKDGQGILVFDDAVTMIGSSAFSGCSSLTSVTIPDSVTSIGSGAFENCTSLTSIIIPDSVTSIGGDAFKNCTGELILNCRCLGLYGGQFTKVVIGNGVTSIGESAFYRCYSLTNVTIGNSVTSIGYQAFYGCSSLTSVNIPDSVTSIGSEAFYGCSSLTSINIPDSVTEIGYGAFYDCYSLTRVYITDIAAWCRISFGRYDANPLFYAHNLYLNGELVTDLTIPDSVTSIGDYAFVYCSSLTSITIPDSVTSIGEEAFYGCTGELIINGKVVETDYYEYSYPAYNGWLKGAKFTKLTIGNNVTSIGRGAFYGCTSLTSITIPDGVTEIGSSTFENCTSLTSATIGNGVTSIGGAAFSGCSSLTSITIPDSVTEIGNYAFCNCTSLTSITIPDSVTSIGEIAFYGCSSLTSVTIPDSVTEIGYRAFWSCSSLTSITIPDSVTEIEWGAFEGCYSLTSVYITDIAAWCNIDFLNSSANPLYNAHNLYLNGELVTDLTIPDSVTSIGDYAFRGCTSLTSITIPDSVTWIEQNAFDGCSSLTSVTIGYRVNSIGYRAFGGCSSLTEVYCKPTTPPSGSNNMFSGTALSRGGIYVPTESVEAYKTAYIWKDYASSIEGYDFE